MNAMQDVEWGECLVEPAPDPEIEKLARENLGLPLPVVRYFTSCPWMARALELVSDHGGRYEHKQGSQDGEHRKGACRRSRELVDEVLHLRG